MLNKKAREFQARRKTPPMTDAEIAEVTEPELPCDYQLGLELYKALKERMQQYQLYGSDVGKDAYNATVEHVRQTRLKERQLNEATRQSRSTPRTPHDTHAT